MPVVASNVGGLPEVIEDGVNGILIEPESPEQLFASIAKILDDETFSAAAHLANRSRAADYSAERMADSYEAIYRRIGL